ncbi:MAG TPA: hypothetical protein VHY19_16885 [Steroidobacteraceae bacterium]|jgi:3-oxoacyl-ACP reductase-like protein|nr:hypothetical protein [Steroidobacteraceae bacterium]
MKRLFLLWMMVVCVPLTALVGCSHGKAPTTSAAPPVSAAPTAPTPAATAAAAAPAAAPAATPAASGAGPAAAAGANNAVPARADLVLLAGAAFDGCKAPSAPPDPPDGNVATRAQMLNSHKLTADFNSATNDYLGCLDQAAQTFRRQYGPVLPPSGLRQVLGLHDSIHNTAVDADKKVADKFNTQLRLYKARGGAS